MRYLATLVLLFALVAVPGSMAAEDAKDFPAAGLDLVDHRLRVEMRKVGAAGLLGEQIETLTFKGRMLVERADPYVNADGHKQVDFIVKSWEAHAYSTSLDTLITYRLSPDAKQKLSSITAQQAESAYPATFRFNVTFDALAFGDVFFDQFEGEPVGEDFMEVPPSGNRRTSPALTGFESARVAMDHPELGSLQFIPLDCEDEGGITIQTFTAESGERTLPIAVNAQVATTP